MSFVSGTRHFVQKITSKYNVLVGLMTFWLGFVKILSYKDLCHLF
jgi:spore maturation protein SpmA